MKILCVLMALCGILFGGDLGITPQVNEWRAGDGEYVLKKGDFVYAGVLGPRDPIFKELSDAAGFDVGLAPADASCAIQFLSGDMLPKNLKVGKPVGEGYVVRIEKTSLMVYSSTKIGKFYGLQTVLQLLELAEKNGEELRLPTGIIVDSPRFEWRGFMLDESRHFTGMKGLKKILDAMGRYKLNRLHWHLTDSAGWRIEIKKYPKLTSVGGRGNETNRAADAPVEFYTQEQVKEIVAYAKARGIVVVPEIDMPGHADAAVKAYPEHDGGGFKSKNDPKKWPHFTFNPARAETLAFLDDILKEVAVLFPDAGVIHYGGDEVHFGWGHWKDLPEVKALMKKEGYTKLAEVEAWFNRRMAKTINGLGFETGGWDEIAARDLSVDKTLVWWWRHDKPNVLKSALTKGYDIILCPRRPLYLDFLQLDEHKVGRRWGGIVPIESTYHFPKDLKISKEHWKQVRGVQANLWTETMRTQARRNFMIWPRLVAVAEVGWTVEGRKDLADFKKRLPHEIKWLKVHGIGSWDPFAKTPEVRE